MGLYRTLRIERRKKLDRIFLRRQNEKSFNTSIGTMVAQSSSHGPTEPWGADVLSFSGLQVVTPVPKNTLVVAEGVQDGRVARR